MSYFTKDLLDFLEDLSHNNNKAFFDRNRKRYEEHVREPFKLFVAELIFRIQEFDHDIEQEPKTAIFRINRDIRFSKDKTPYKTHIAASINGGKRNQRNLPGYYIHIGKDGINLGGGAYFVDRVGTQALRNEIKDNPDTFKSLLQEPSFKNFFGGTLHGEKNKRIPAEFKQAFEVEPLVANKNFYYMADLPKDMVLEPEFMDIITMHYHAAHKINAFLKQAFSGI